MKLSDVSNGPDWIVWVVFVIFVLLSVLLLTGHGSSLIAGYNTASEEEKEKYDTRKLCRITGVGMAFVAPLILIMLLFEDTLPASFARIGAVLIFADCLVIILLGNIICMK